jgi:hypothetical protein
VDELFVSSCHEIGVVPSDAPPLRYTELLALILPGQSLILMRQLVSSDAQLIRLTRVVVFVEVVADPDHDAGNWQFTKSTFVSSDIASIRFVEVPRLDKSIPNTNPVAPSPADDAKMNEVAATVPDNMLPPLI